MFRNIKSTIISVVLFILLMVVIAKVISHFLVYEPQNQSQFSELKYHQKSSDSQPVLILEQNKKITLSSNKVKGASGFEEISNYMDEFDMPGTLKNNLLDSAQKQTLSDDWADEKEVDEQLSEVELSLEQVAGSNLDSRSKNLTEGFSASDKAFNEMYEAALPLGGNENSQTRELKSQALADLGFSAVSQLNHEQAEKAFTAVLAHYPETQSAPIIQLEYAQLLFETERPQEAIIQIDEAIDKHSRDAEFIKIAQELKDAIEGYE
ncbi:MAG: tetratricopeptide repeat protein [Omnitrophica bacterium]|nr:tetratricopeptide repeat protein [Candidatus Omnitrophota bacterium]